MSRSKYNRKQIGDEHLLALIEHWQRTHPPLSVDGWAGPNTLRSIELSIDLGMAIEWFWPLRDLEDGRHPVQTSGFKTDNPSRPNHNGVDLFYPWRDDDPHVKAGDGGAIIVNGKRRWWYPDGAVAVAMADGIVQRAKRIPTGWHVWVHHRNGERTGYFHGAELLVGERQVVSAGEPLIVVGDNPLDRDAKHLHLEWSPVDRYAPMNPRRLLERARYLPAA